MKRVFLIDSMSHIFRAYFAPMGARQEPLRNSKGQVTQAVFVFTNMLRKLINDEKPDYIAAVFDTAAPTFRHDSYEAYKANREEMPEDLAAQLPFIIRVCEAFNLPILKYDGYEADDIIGTLAKKAADKKLQAVIVSNDKDLCQLVRDPYVIAMRQNSANVKRKVPVPPIEWCDEAWVEAKFGVPPSKIIDLLGLMGDSIDNIPGAPGIGEKGALKLVQEFGSAIGAMENADKVTHKTYRESLQNNQEIIRQSLELATVHCEVPIELDLDQLRFREPDRQKAYELFRELEFNSLTKEFSDAATLFDMHGSEAASDRIERKYEAVKTRKALDKLIRTLWEKEKWAFDVDDSNTGDRHSAFDKAAPLSIAISYAPGVSYFIDLQGFEGGSEYAVRMLGDTFANPYMTKACHDYKRNLGVLRAIGIEPREVKEDPMIAAYLLDSGRSNFSLDFLAQNHLDAYPPIDTPEGFTASGFAAAERADMVYQLVPQFRKKIAEDELTRIYDEIEVPLEPILADIETAGMKIDSEALHDFSEKISKELETLSSGSSRSPAASSTSVAKAGRRGLSGPNIATGKKTATGQISTSKDVLAELAVDHEIAQLIIDYREMDKLKATYADSLPKMVGDGRTSTACSTRPLRRQAAQLDRAEPAEHPGPAPRWASRSARRSSPKRQQLISPITHSSSSAFWPHHQRPGDARGVSEQRGHHAKTARLVFGATDEKDLKEKRRLAKIVNFGIAYAVEAFGLSQRVGISKQEARKVIDDYFATYKGIRAYMDRIPEEAREKGYVTSLFGRRRYFPGIKDRNFAVRSRAEREAINMPIQGTASDIVKIAMINVAKALRDAGLKTKMIMQVHDELLFEAPKDEVEQASAIIKREMEAARF